VVSQQTPPPRAARTQSSSLFAPAQPMSALSQAPGAPAPQAPSHTEPHRSLFGRVTGVLGFRHASDPTPRAQQAQPQPSPAAEPASEQARPTVRQTTAEDIGIGIPKFLLRQTSATAAPQRR
jgi:hypothetical protein